MRCPLCQRVIADSVLGIQSHWRYAHGQRWQVPPGYFTRPREPDLAITARRAPVRAVRRHPPRPQYRVAERREPEG